MRRPRSGPGAVAEPSTRLPWLQARSPDDRICPFLRAVADDDGLGFPVEAPDAANRCASMREAVPQSLRQQELVCLTAAHVNCPRYLRGAAAATDAAPVTVRQKAVITPAISAALVILALSFGASVVFGLANGGLVIPSGGSASPAAASLPAVGVGSSARPAASATATSAPTSPVPSASSTTRPIAEAQRPAQRVARRDASSQPDHHAVGEPGDDVDPLQAAQGVSRQAELLDLHGPLGRQPLQHRPLLRRAAQAGQDAQPLDEDPEPASGQEADPPEPDPLVAGRQAAATRRPSPQGRRRRPAAPGLAPGHPDHPVCLRPVTTCRNGIDVGRLGGRMARSGAKW